MPSRCLKRPALLVCRWTGSVSLWRNRGDGRRDGAAEGGGPVGHAVQRAADSAGRGGWTGLRRDRQSHDYTGPGHYPPAGPAGEARPDFAQPGEQGPADGDGRDYAGGPGTAGADGGAGAGDAPQPAGSPGTGAAGSIDGVIAGCAPGNELILRHIYLLQRISL